MPIRELHDKALYKKRPNQFPTHPTRNNNYSNRTEQPFLGPRDGTCHIYNKYQSCNRKNCIFQHVCKSCRGPHPQIILIWVLPGTIFIIMTAVFLWVPVVLAKFLNGFMCITVDYGTQISCSRHESYN